MPRLDKTFSDKDVLRIITNHLTNEEREVVLIALLTAFDVENIKGVPTIVPLTSKEEALVESGIIDSLIQLIVSFFTGLLPATLFDLIFTEEVLRYLYTNIKRVLAELKERGQF